MVHLDGHGILESLETFRYHGDGLLDNVILNGVRVVRETDAFLPGVDIVELGEILGRIRVLFVNGNFDSLVVD